jgi:hypothetical protein
MSRQRLLTFPNRVTAAVYPASLSVMGAPSRVPALSKSYNTPYSHASSTLCQRRVVAFVMRVPDTLRQRLDPHAGRLETPF